MAIKVKFRLLVGDRWASRDETVELVARYSGVNQLVKDILCVGRLHNPTSRASDTDREQSVPTSPLLSQIKDWTKGTTVVILEAAEVEEEIPEALCHDPRLMLFAANAMCLEERRGS
jgi:hypothetical protein